MTDPSRSQSGRQGSGSGEAIPPWTCALTRRCLDARRLRCLRAAAGTRMLASWSLVPRPGPARRQLPRTEIRASLAATSLLESAAARKTRAACGPPALPRNRRRRGITALAAWICCRCPASVRVCVFFYSIASNRCPGTIRGPQPVLHVAFLMARAVGGFLKKRKTICSR